MNRLATAAAALAATLTLATASTAAFAHGGHGHGEPEDAAAFPMKADAFERLVTERLAKRKAHLEAKIVEEKLEEAQAKEMRAHFEERAAKVHAAANEAEKDGIVTLEEAREVRRAGGGHKHAQRGR